MRFHCANGLVVLRMRTVRGLWRWSPAAQVCWTQENKVSTVTGQQCFFQRIMKESLWVPFLHSLITIVLLIVTHKSTVDLIFGWLKEAVTVECVFPGRCSMQFRSPIFSVKNDLFENCLYSGMCNEQKQIFCNFLKLFIKVVNLRGRRSNFIIFYVGCEWFDLYHCRFCYFCNI